MQHDLAIRLTRIDRPTDRVQIRVGQHASTVVSQADARIVQSSADLIGTRIDERAELRGSMVFHARGLRV